MRLLKEGGLASDPALPKHGRGLTRHQKSTFCARAAESRVCVALAAPHPRTRCIFALRRNFRALRRCARALRRDPAHTSRFSADFSRASRARAARLGRVTVRNGAPLTADRVLCPLPPRRPPVDPPSPLSSPHALSSPSPHPSIPRPSSAALRSPLPLCAQRRIFPPSSGSFPPSRCAFQHRILDGAASHPGSHSNVTVKSSLNLNFRVDAPPCDCAPVRRTRGNWPRRRELVVITNRCLCTTNRNGILNGGGGGGGC